MFSKPAFFYSRDRTSEYLDAEAGADERRTAQRTNNNSSSSSSSSSSSGDVPIRPARNVQFLKSLPVLTVEGFEEMLETEMARGLALVGVDNQPRPARDRRRRREIVTNLMVHMQQMKEAKETLDGELVGYENHLEGDQELVIGTLEKDPRQALLARAADHHPHCCAEGCTNQDPTRALCLTCANGYCPGHAGAYQDQNIVVIGSDHESVDVDARDGGFILCCMCGVTLSDSRVINIPAISANVYHPEIDTTMFAPAPELQGTGTTILTGEQMTKQYSSKVSSVPNFVGDAVPHAVFQVCELKPTLQQRTGANRMTDSDDGLVCPGCGDANCQLTCAAGKKQWKFGWDHIVKLRAALKQFGNCEALDQKWNFIMQHVRFEKLKKAQLSLTFKSMSCPEETEQARVESGITCKFCSKATVEILNECDVHANAVDLAAMKKHTRRGVHACGKTMYDAGLTYIARHGASKEATLMLPGPPGAPPQKVNRTFFQRLFNVKTRTLSRHIKKKREGTLYSDIRRSCQKGGMVGGLTELQCDRLEQEMKLVEQTQSHYIPSGQNNAYRFPPGHSKAKFWYAYAEHWDIDFYNQCERLHHKFGLDASKKRPSDATYLADALEHCSHEEYDKIKAIFDARATLRTSIETTRVSLAALVVSGAAVGDGSQEQYDALADQLLEMEAKLKNGKCCNIKADVSYSAALKFYHRYRMKFGIVAVDTCKYCEGQKLAHSRAQSATKKKKIMDEWEVHRLMAKNGYDWRAQDIARAQVPGNKTQTMVIDYGQGLRTPLLNIGVSWYRRILKVSPYIIVTYGSGDKKKDVKYYLSDETKCGKGPDEVISYVHHNIMNSLLEDTELLIVHFDGCYGQANNNPFLCFIADLTDASSPFYIPQLKRAILKRNPVGHTFCVCDTVHAEVSKKKNTLSLNGVVHTAYRLPPAVLATFPPNVRQELISWQQVIEECGFTCIVVEQKDVLAYVDYLKDGTMYRNSINDAFRGGKIETNWKHSAQHLFEIGIWDEHMGPKQPEKQTSARGYIRTAETWDVDEQYLVRLWRSKGTKKNGTFRIEESNLGRARTRMAVNLDPQTNLPKQKYTELIPLCVLKIMNLWQNARDCGFGMELITVYPALTDAQLAQHTTLVNARKKKKGDAEDFVNY